MSTYSENEGSETEVIVTGDIWLEFIKNPNQWDRAVGVKILDNEYGQGEIVGIITRENSGPLVRLRFGAEEIKFNEASFRGSETQIIVSRSSGLFSQDEISDLLICKSIHESRKQSERNIEREQEKRELEAENVFQRVILNRSLWHMTHISNLHNIFECGGLLSKNEAVRRCLLRKDISDWQVQDRRAHIRDSIFRKPLHEYVPLYFNPRNPMLYKRRKMEHEICMIEVNPRRVALDGCVLTDGNAASHRSAFFLPRNGVENVDWKLIDSGSWSDQDDGRRRMCAEFLVPEKVSTDAIVALHCINDNLLRHISRYGVTAKSSPELYF